MSIVFIQTNMYPFRIGGAEVFDYYLISSLKHYYDIEVFSFKKPKGWDIKYHLIQNIYPKRLTSPIMIFIKIFLMKKKIKMIHLRFSRTSWLNCWPYPLIKKLLGIPYIITIHGGGLSKWFFKKPYISLFRHASVIFGVSDRICYEYEKRTGKKIKLISSLIPFTTSSKKAEIIRKKYDLDLKSFLFCVVGSIKKLKNPEIVIEALTLLGEEYLKLKNVFLIFAGDGPLRVQIQNKIKNTMIEKHVKFLGNIPRKCISEIYKISDAYIIASDYEGTPISLLEAIYNRIPVIASNSPGINAIVEDNISGFLFDYHDVNHLTKIMKKIIENPSLHEVVTKNALDTFKKKYSYERLLSEYKNAIEEVL